MRRADLIWEGEDEMRTYSRIAASSTQAQQSIPDYIKGLLKNIITSVVRLFM